MWNQWNLFKKIDENLYIDLFWSYFGPKTDQKLARMDHFSHTPQSTYNVPVNQVSWSYIKKQFDQKPVKFPFLSIFVIKDPLKIIEAKNQNSTHTNFWIILLCTFKPNIGKLAWKQREPIMSGQTDRRTAPHWISSPDYVSSGASNVLNDCTEN